MYTSKKAFWSFIPFFINAVALTIFGKELDRFSTIAKLDYQLNGYDRKFILHLFSQYGLQGRATYHFLTILDISFPFLLFLFGFFYFGFTWCKWRCVLIWKLLLFFCGCFLVFDCIENYCVLKILYNYPNLNNVTVYISSWATRIKLVSLIIVYSFMIITVIVQVYKLIRGKS